MLLTHPQVQAIQKYCGAKGVNVVAAKDGSSNVTIFGEKTAYLITPRGDVKKVS